MQLMSFSSGYDPCGVNDYNRHLTHALASHVEVETVRYPTQRVARHQLRALFEMRRAYRDLAARADGYDVALVHFTSKYWNGGRPVENMLPVFLRRLQRPAVAILHEWPTAIGVNRHDGSWPARAAKAALTSVLVKRDIGAADYVDWQQRQVFKTMSHIVVHTPEFRDRLLAAGVAAPRITLTPFPLHRLPRPCWRPDEVEARFALDGKRALVMLGLPNTRKGFELAVQALPSLPEDVVLLLVCSERTERERAAVDELREVARVHGVASRLVTTGYLDDAQLASVFQVVRLALTPFKSVTGSSSIAHYFAAGIPVVTTDLPPMRLASSDGAGVELVAPDDVSSLAAGIARLLASPDALARMRDANARYAESYTFERLGDIVRDLAERALKEAGGR